jgi:uncharacterized membrane-anchored protein
VQHVELGVLALAVVGGLSVLAIRTDVTRDLGQGRWLQLLIGLVLGGAAAFIVLVTQTDLVPDQLEAFVDPILVAGITVLLLAGTVRRLSRW